MKKVIVGLGALILGAFAPSLACQSANVPVGPTVEAGAQVANDVCSLIQGIDNTGVVRTICATVEEIALLVPFILTLRTGDAGAPASSACSVLPGTAFCATPQEIAKGVLFLTHVRNARLSHDGGKP